MAVRSRRALALLACLLVAGAVAGRLEAQPAPNDPEYGRQRNLTAIHAPEAWLIERGQPSVVLAVLSSGVDVSHPDLERNLWRNPATGGPCAGDVRGCNVSGVVAGMG